MSGEMAVHFPAPSDDSISEMLRSVTREIDAMGAASKGSGCFGGADGYGCDYENDVFLMHRYCWCEDIGCPWCGGCSGTGRNEPHSEACYSTRLDGLRDRHQTKSMFDENPAYAKERTALCVEMSLDPEYGCEVHCTCDREVRASACDCDYHQGRGAFRFGKAAEAPNFWHKPTGIRVRWYKYIGRGMEVELHGQPFDIEAVRRSVLESLPPKKEKT